MSKTPAAKILALIDPVFRSLGLWRLRVRLVSWLKHRGRLSHRLRGYSLLSGHGIEVGAAHHPAALPLRCSVEYCDVVSKGDSAALFPEVPSSDFVEVDHICNLDTTGLPVFGNDTLDYVIANHVLEHVANPLRSMAVLFRVARPGGCVALSIPDRDFTYDRKRPLTTFEHLAHEFDDGVTSVSPEHYLDFIKGVHPEIMALPQVDIDNAVRGAAMRREHAHVWNSSAFSEFLSLGLKKLEIQAECMFESRGECNEYEYFGVWRKLQE